MKKFFTIAVIIFVSFLTLVSQRAYAVDEVWAAGYIQVKYVGAPNPDCNTNLNYRLYFHFYRDGFSTTPFPQALPSPPNNNAIIASSQSLNQSFEIPVTIMGQEEMVEQNCLNNSPVTTEGAVYQSSTFSLDKAEDWVFSYTGEGRSNEYNNVMSAQNFHIETRINNFHCGIVTGSNGSGTNDLTINTVDFNPEIPVTSFCTNKTYDYRFSATDSDNDTIRYSLTPARTDGISVAANYVLPSYSFDYPFPMQENRFDLHRRTGKVTFTPTQRFTSLITVRVDEERKVYVVNSVGELEEETIVVSSTFYETRFIIDNNCAELLPDFEGVVGQRQTVIGPKFYRSTYNASENAYEFDCGTDSITFNLSQPLLCSTFDKNDFRIGLGYNGVDTLAEVIKSAYFADVDPLAQIEPFSVRNNDCSASGEFNQVTLVLYDGLGPGGYNIFFRHGNNDNTTIKNKCDNELPINTPFVRIYINDNLTYDHPRNDYTYCDPATPQDAIATAYQKGKLIGKGRSFYTWEFLSQPRPNDPVTIFSNDPKPNPINGTIPPPTGTATQNGRGSQYDVKLPTDYQQNQDRAEGTWEVGFGLDYSTYDINGNLVNEAICYDTDQFDVVRFKNPAVEIPDYDLCPEDDFPIIDVDSMVTKHTANRNEISFTAYRYFPRTKPVLNQLQSNDFDTVSTGRSIYEVPGAQVDRFNVFTSNIPLYVNGHRCVERDTFFIVKNEVKADIGPTDTTICIDAQYTLENAEDDYLFPEAMSYRWFFNDEELPNDTLDELMMEEEGEYKLEVIKLSNLGSTCNAFDSINVEIADSLTETRVACQSVTFKDGQITQNFVWDVIDGADDYRVRGVFPNGAMTEWEKPNGEGGIQHEIGGEQLILEVRGVNYEVEETADCYYGPISSGEACDVIVKPTNVFTPNGDGINETLTFSLLEVYPNSTLQVYNRWGKLIFESSDYKNDWDGEDYKAGTYFYVLDINDPEYDIFKGTFTIIR